MDHASFERQLQKGFDDPNADANLSPGMTAVHVVTQESEHPEYAWLRLERLAAGVAVQAASVGNFSYVILTNPAGSGAIITVKRIFLVNNTGASVQMHQREGLVAALAGVTNLAGRLLDLRYGPPGTVRATGLVGVATPAAHFTGGFSTRITMQSNDTKIIDMPTVLPPGSWLAIAGNVANQETTASFRWTERAAEPGELQGSGV